MRYITDRKRAEGRGAAGTGTQHHWFMTVTSVGLAILIPIFVYIFGSTLGGTHAEVVATFTHPFVAIVSGLTIAVGMRHFAKGATTLIEDYIQGLPRKCGIIFVEVLSWAVIATGLFALARIAI